MAYLLVNVKLLKVLLVSKVCVVLHRELLLSVAYVFVATPFMVLLETGLS